MGEGLPGMFQRVDVMVPAVTELKRPVTAYLRENLHYTFSGFFFPATFLSLLLELGGVDRIMRQHEWLTNGGDAKRDCAKLCGPKWLLAARDWILPSLIDGP
jgi:hypothetical protein